MMLERAHWQLLYDLPANRLLDGSVGCSLPVGAAVAIGSCGDPILEKAGGCLLVVFALSIVIHRRILLVDLTGGAPRGARPSAAGLLRERVLENGGAHCLRTVVGRHELPAAIAFNALQRDPVAARVDGGQGRHRLRQGCEAKARRGERLLHPGCLGAGGLHGVWQDSRRIDSYWGHTEGAAQDQATGRRNHGGLHGSAQGCRRALQGQCALCGGHPVACPGAAKRHRRVEHRLLGKGRHPPRVSRGGNARGRRQCRANPAGGGAHLQVVELPVERHILGLHVAHIAPELPAAVSPWTL
mmetsp:Transcript_20844/g.57836  ORF Transcript_20844/g.57836 Transcript_20844/m.57836 type:complete len:299 (-) Transcript_20844:1616-2512(-)